MRAVISSTCSQSLSIISSPILEYSARQYMLSWMQGTTPHAAAGALPGRATRKPYCSGSSQVDRVNDTLACHRACNPLAVQQATAFEYQIVFEFSAFVHLSQVDQPLIKT